MTFAELIQQTISQTISGLIVNAPWFILIYWSVKTIAKQTPTWLEQWEKSRLKILAVERAMNMRHD